MLLLRFYEYFKPSTASTNKIIHNHEIINIIINILLFFVKFQFFSAFVVIALYNINLLRACGLHIIYHLAALSTNYSVLIKLQFAVAPRIRFQTAKAWNRRIHHRNASGRHHHDYVTIDCITTYNYVSHIYIYVIPTRQATRRSSNQWRPAAACCRRFSQVFIQEISLVALIIVCRSASRPIFTINRYRISAYNIILSATPRPSVDGGRLHIWAYNII